MLFMENTELKPMEFLQFIPTQLRSDPETAPDAPNSSQCKANTPQILPSHLALLE